MAFTDNARKLSREMAHLVCKELPEEIFHSQSYESVCKFKFKLLELRLLLALLLVPIGKSSKKFENNQENNLLDGLDGG